MTVKTFFEAQEIADSAARGSAIISVLVGWWKEYREQDNAATVVSFNTPPVMDFSELFQNNEICVTKDLEAGFQAFREYPQNNDTHDIHYDAASILIARSIAEAILDSESSWKDFSLALLLCEFNDTFRQELESYILNSILRHSVERDKWVAALITGEWRPERAVMSGQRPMVDALKARWAREKDPFSIWQAPPTDVTIFEDSLYPVILLFRSRLPIWVDEFERLPFPAVKDAFIQYLHDELDKHRILALVQGSSSIFENGTWNKKTAILYAPLLCYFKAIYHEAESNNIEELQKEFADIFNVLLSRVDDGLIITNAFLEWLLRQFHLALSGERAEAIQPLLDVVTQVVAGRDASPIQDNWFQFFGYVMAEHEHISAIKSPSETDSLFNRYLLLLKNVDDDTSSVLSANCTPKQMDFFAYWSGFVFSVFPSSCVKWLEAWNSLDQQREAAWHWRFNGRDPLLGNIALIEGGLGLINRNHMEPAMSDELFQLWLKLNECCFSLWVRRCAFYGDTIKRLIIRSVLYAALFLRDKVTECIGQFARLARQDSELVALVAINLKANNIDLDDIVKGFNKSSVDLMESLISVMEWAALSKKKKDAILSEQCGALIAAVKGAPS